MITVGAIATAVYLVAMLVVLEVWATHRRHSTRPWGWTGFRSQPAVPVSRLTGAGFLVAVIAGLAAAVLTRAGLITTVRDRSTIQIVVGVLLAAAGLVVGLAAGHVLRRHPASDNAGPARWLTSAPFALSRNPVFTALILIQLGVTIIAPTWLSILALALLVGVCQLQVRTVEEPYLIQTSGQPYRDYAHRTGRFIPGIGRNLTTGTRSRTD